ncbi:AAA family ATPase [Pseudomonas donghuensis]|uniref:AAA family ATPase n=1 Tax=Pseudomonas donghuensis TaxID=1163398 RepID=UPI002E123254|nr:AAA family ATPase [Pseudomonas donghuensis]
MITPKISEIRIYGLFGYLDHVIPLHSGGITFVHGPNGCGKTTVLKIVAAIFEWQPYVLMSEEFNRVEIIKDDGVELVLAKIFEPDSEDDSERKKTAALSFSVNVPDCEEYILSRDMGSRISASDIEDYLPHFTRVGPREWVDRKTGSRYEFAEALARIPDSSINFGKGGRPDWLRNYVASISLHFIKTQRLLNFDGFIGASRRPRGTEESVTEVIQLYSNEIKELISKKLAEQAAVSQLHDRSFPERLLSLSDNEADSEESIRTMYADTEQKIQKLVEAGLIDQQKNIALPTKALEQTERKVLSLYLVDVNKKLGVFDELQKKIEIFLEIVSPKLRTKDFSVNRQHGFSIESRRQPGRPLSPAQLSSGEQHQIVLFYELIFKAEPNAFFLVDEPEISWHVDWQRSFISDIHKISSLGDRSFLIATHSPQIIGSHRDLAVPLEEGIL